MNKNNDLVVSDNAGIADSFFSRFLGLMFSKPRDLVLVSPCEDVVGSSIHMLFMRFPIDALWLDSGMMVVDIKKSILPFNILKRRTWRIYRPDKPAKYVVELGKGDIGNTERGDEIVFLQ